MDTDQFPPPPPEAPDATSSAVPGAEAPHSEQGPRASGADLRDMTRLRRIVQGRQIAGVAGGLARHFDLDPIVVRVLLVVSAFFGGAGLLVYGALWLLIPEDGTNENPLGLDDRNRGALVLGVGVLGVFVLIGGTWGFLDFPWLAVPVGIAILIFLALRGPAASRTTAPPGQYQPQVPGAAPFGQPQPYPPAQPTAGLQWNGRAWVPAGAAAAPPPGATGPQPPYQPYQPQRPRHRGPILFGWTMALTALALGLLGFYDVMGADIATSLYPAVALTIVGAALVLGAFWGRAGGLILVGLLLLPLLAITSAADTWDVDEHRLHLTPVSASAVSGSYQRDTGEIILDLRTITDPAGLDGRTIALDVDLGRVEVIVPPSMELAVTARVDGIGSMRVLDRQQDGVDLTMRHHRGATMGDPQVTLDLRVGVGEIVVQEGAPLDRDGLDPASPDPVSLDPAAAPAAFALPVGSGALS